MDTMPAAEKMALKERAVAALKAAIKKGTDPADLAKRCDIPPEAFGRYLTGESFPPPARAQEILDALGVK